MKEEINYQERFKATFEPGELRKLIDRWDDDDAEDEFTKDELMEIMRYEGRRRLEIVEEAKKLEKEIEAHNKKYNDSIKIADWALNGLGDQNIDLDILDRNIE